MKYGLSALALLSAFSGSAWAAELAISCGAVGQELQLCKEGVAEWEKRPAIR